MLVTTDNNRFESLRHGFNLRFSGELFLKQIYVCLSTAEVSDALTAIVNTEEVETPRVTIRGGGHCYEGFVTIGSKLIIDISQLKEKSILSDGEMYHVIGSGVTNWEAIEYLFKRFGLCLPGGSCYSVGLGGHVCGGGYGLLSRKYGLTVDYLSGVELVYCDGQQIQTKVFRENDEIVGNENEINDNDVVWAHKGCGGGNYGVITKYYFTNLPPAPAKVLLVQRAWTWTGLQGEDLASPEDDGLQYTYEPFRNLLRNYGKFWSDHISYRNGVKVGADSNLDYNNMFSLLAIRTNYNGVGEIVLTVQWAIDDNSQNVIAAKIAIEQFYESLVPTDVCECRIAVNTGGHSIACNFMANTVDIVEYPWLTATMNLNGSGPAQCFKNKSAYMLNTFTEHEIDTIINYSVNADPRELISNGLVQIDSYGGMVNAVVDNATAVSHRSSCMKLQYQVYWSLEQKLENKIDCDSAVDDMKLNVNVNVNEDTELPLGLYCRKWIHEFYQCMYKDYENNEPYDMDGNTHVSGCYISYCDVDLVNWQVLYYQQNYARLQAVKTHLDPRQLFWHRQSIRAEDMEDKTKSLLRKGE